MDKIAEIAEAKTGAVPTCRDYDEDCQDVKDKIHCYLYDPAKGMCPYLRKHLNGE